MALLVGSLQSYMMLEVIEVGWKEFMQKLNTTQDLDRLIGRLLALSLNIQRLPPSKPRRRFWSH